jgi:hypothetical protein
MNIVNVMIALNEYFDVYLLDEDEFNDSKNSPFQRKDIDHGYKSIFEDGDYYIFETYNRVYMKFLKEYLNHFKFVVFERKLYSECANEMLYSVSISEEQFVEIKNISERIHHNSEMYAGEIYKIDDDNRILRKGGVMFANDMYSIFQNERLYEEGYILTLGSQCKGLKKRKEKYDDIRLEEMIKLGSSSNRHNLDMLSSEFNIDVEKLDYTVASLRYLDSVIYWNADNVDEYLAMYLFAKYIGEVMINEFECKWKENNNNGFVLVYQNSKELAVDTYDCTMGDCPGFYIDYVVDNLVHELTK